MHARTCYSSFCFGARPPRQARRDLIDERKLHEISQYEGDLVDSSYSVKELNSNNFKCTNVTHIVKTPIIMN